MLIHGRYIKAVVAMGMPDTLVLVSPFRSKEVIYNQPEFTK